MRVTRYLYILLLLSSCNFSKNKNIDGTEEIFDFSACDVILNTHNYIESTLSEYVSHYSHLSSGKRNGDMNVVISSIATYFPVQHTCYEDARVVDTFAIADVLELFSIDSLPNTQDAFIAVKSEIQYQLNPSLLSSIMVLTDSLSKSAYDSFFLEVSKYGVVNVNELNDSLEFFPKTESETTQSYQLLFAEQIYLEKMPMLLREMEKVRYVRSATYNDLFLNDNRYIEIFRLQTLSD